MTTWHSTDPLPVIPPPRGARLRVLRRAAALIALLLAGLAVHLPLRLVERVRHGAHRPWTPAITQTVCRLALRLIGLRLHIAGTPMTARGAVVANHASWLDIFVLNAGQQVTFVSKSEVASWPGIGLLARVTGTLFITRDPRAARSQADLFAARLLAGQRLLLFPEGTSTDGRRVLPFKTTLFAAFMAEDMRHDLAIQPVSVIYTAPHGADARFYGWWGDMAFGPHLAQVLAAPRQGSVRVIYHAPLRVDAYPNRKSLAAALEQAVRAPLAPQPGPQQHAAP